MESKRPRKKRALPREYSAAGSAERSIEDATNALTEAVSRLSKTLISTAELTASDATSRGLQAATTSLEELAAKLASTKKSSVVREDVFNAAAQAFADRGYDGVSVDEIATTAGYTKGAVYSRFTSKSALFIDVLTAKISPCVPQGDSIQNPSNEDDADLRLRLVLEAITFGLRHEEHREAIAELLSASLIALTRELEPELKDVPQHEIAISPAAVLTLSAATILPALHDLGVVDVDDMSNADLFPPQP